MTQITQIRNFCIIAHIDHGKSTLADRLLEYTNTVSKRTLQAQHLDQMELERERGITIKLQPVRMEYNGYVLNLIDTPGHVDFTYEVSRSLAACEGALLLVDATQGVQAQTIANLYLALDQGLEIIPVINKIDLPAAQVSVCEQEMIALLGCKKEDILKISAKTGVGIEGLIHDIIDRIPSPKSQNDGAKALIFDSQYDEYRGVIAYVRVFSGTLKKGQNIQLMAKQTKVEIIDIGVLRPQFEAKNELSIGEIGYVSTGLREVELCQVGDTIADFKVTQPLPGYKTLKPMVYAGVYCKEGSEFEELREAIGKLKLNDAALEYSPEYSPVLGYGFRCGFLGMLHLEIFQQRVQREFQLDIITTIPSVAYQIKIKEGVKEITYQTHGQNVKKVAVENQMIMMSSPLDFPDPMIIDDIFEPFVTCDIFVPEKYIGGVMQLVAEKRGVYKNTEYVNDGQVTDKRVILHYDMPLSSILVDFYDSLKSVSSGYASLNYEFTQYMPADVVRMDILVASKPVDALSCIVYRDDAYRRGRKIVESLKEVLPRQMFEIKIQAAIGSKIIASERIPAMRKDVTAKLYGGDVTRKRKLLEKQKKGKKKMKEQGKVDIPSEAYMAVLKS